MSALQQSEGTLGLGRKNRAIVSIAMWAAALIFISPVLILVGTSLQPPDSGYGLNIIPPEITLENYIAVLGRTNILRLFLNSTIVTVTTVLVVVLFGSLAAFGLVRRPFPGSFIMIAALMIGLVLAPAVLIVPLFTIVKQLRLLDSYLGLIAPYGALFMGVGALLFMNAFRSIPPELFDAADVDGASLMQAYWRIGMPLARPTVAAVTIVTGLGVWNEFLFALLFTRDESTQTIQLAWVVYSGQYELQFERQFALLLLISLPMVVFFLIFQRQFVAGLTGAVKE